MNSQGIADRDVAKQMLVEAATLCGRCAGFWRDEADYSSNEVQVHYAVDVDVVMMYSDPQRMSGEGYGRVFSQAGDISELVTSLLGHFILHRLSQPFAVTAEATPKVGHPLILIPPHDAELKRMVLAISHKEASLTRSDLKCIDEAKEDLSKRLRGLQDEAAIEAFLSFLSERASELLNLLLGHSGTAAELLRLNMLPVGCLVHLRNHPAFKVGGCLDTPPPRDGSGQDTLEMLQFADDWFKLMLEENQHLSGYRRSRIDDDAWVLATLQWVNANAARRGLKQRIVLITATKRILDAGNKQRASHDGFNTFAEAYLRDPRAFMGAKNFFSPRGDDGSDTKFRMLEWMAVLFPNSIRQQRVEHFDPLYKGSTVRVDAKVPDVCAITDGVALNAALDILLSEGYRQIQGMSFPESAIAEWREVVRDTHTLVVLQSQQTAQSTILADLLRGLPSSGSDRFEHLMACLSKRVQSSFSKLYLATGVIGVEQLLERNSSMRGLPALRFDLPDYREAQVQYDALSEALFNEDGRPESFDLAKMYERLASSDDSNYHAHVLHAFVYASTGRWFSARTLCRVAMLIVDALPKSKAGRRTGREAAYLMAVAERRLAIDEAKLQLAAAALDQARQRSPGNEARDLRFASEELAQTITRRQLAYFRGQVRPAVDPAPDLEEARRLCELAASGSEPHSVRCWVVRQSATNGLLSALMASDVVRRSSQIEGAVLRLIVILESERLAPRLPSSLDRGRLYGDDISDFVWLVAVAVFETKPRSHEARQVLASRLPPDHSQSILCFERRRYEEFMRLAGLEPIGSNGSAAVPGSGMVATEQRQGIE